MSLITGKGVVEQDQCDRIGHMNVEHYARIVSESVFRFFEMTDWQSIADDENVDIVGVRLDLRFKREMWPGDAYHIQSRIVAINDCDLTMEHQIILNGSGKIAATAVVEGVCIGRADRKRHPIPLRGKLRLGGDIARTSSSPVETQVCADDESGPQQPGDER